MNQPIPAANRDVTAKDNNAPDYAKLETERLADEYVGYSNTLSDLKTEETALPEEITDDTTALKAGGIIKQARDLKGRMEETRNVEVQPHLRRQNAINTFFKSQQESIQPEDKRERLNRPGLIDRVQAKISAWQAKKEAAERARLEAERKERERTEREAREEAERKAEAAKAAEKAAQDAREAADRARSEEGRKARQAEADAAATLANQAAAAAKSAEVKVETAAENNQDARIATLAKSSDVVRVQGKTMDGGGVTLTKATEKFAYVTDRALFDEATKLLLFDHFNDAEVDKAVRSFATATRYSQTLPGCEIGTRKKDVTR